MRGFCLRCKGVNKSEKVRGSPLRNGVKLEMLPGNANVNYDPSRESEVDIQTGTLVPARVHVAGERSGETLPGCARLRGRSEVRHLWL